MKMPGYCNECHRIRQVSVSSAGFVGVRGVVFGICQECEDEQETKRKERRR